MRKRGKVMDKIDALISLLLDGIPLNEQYQDHPLRGSLAGYRGCHVEPDWVLIYAIRENDLILFRNGTHSDILE
jgi:mRNA interferase YafQ